MAQQQQQQRMFGTSHRRPATATFIKLQDYINKDWKDVVDTINKLRLDEVKEHINQIYKKLDDFEFGMEELERIEEILKLLEEHEEYLKRDLSTRTLAPQAPERDTTDERSSRGPLIHGGPASRSLGWTDGGGILENYKKLNPFNEIRGSGFNFFDELEKRRTPEGQDRLYCSISFANRRFVSKEGKTKAMNSCMAKRKKEREAKQGNGIPLIALATMARQFKGHL